VSDIEQATKVARAMVTEFGMSSKLGAVKYGTDHGDPFLGRTMGTQADYSHEVARDIDDEVRKLIEAAHTEAWEILTEYRDVLDTLAGELLEKETLHRAELEGIFGDVQKRPRLTMFDDFGGRIPSDKPPIKTPGELAIERGDPWPPPVAEPAFKAAIARANQAAEDARAEADGDAYGPNGSHGGQGTGNLQPAGQGQGLTQPDYGAPAGWYAPGWPPQQQQPNHWYPPAQPPQQPYWPQPAPSYPGPQGQPGNAYAPYPPYPYPPYPPPGPSNPDAGQSPDPQGDDVSRSNPPAHG
jgi:cell division protease FtsH